ncbi:iron uptake transporter deferrochelatase/peroxidase subunit [Sphaerisporangium sp. TRM90804]|uniref:iron uptake transporter deferrochelatase/peroxidase subunit n=1 Tax=Sphaerisporangium sp. TRM90804 TaxID=3031113 RepID=UPI002447D138|nr:iron uptake transporter deferrochelatase/peroxidase subunit [Sphaerisporangium sp. TRM90804]MDH2426484.1 iron uptake transporter deferrochelatase/peroxidase subunit [Sphaerisporangium sp. TRM90804]
MTPINRRRLFELGAAGVAAAGAGALATRALTDDPAPAAVPSTSDPVPFYGERQAGIVTPAQDRLHFVSLDVVTKDRAELTELLQEWTAAAARMTQGKDAGTFGATGGSAEAPPDDTGEALGLPASGLTLTIGFGPSLFDDRFGLAARKPAALAELPKFPGDDLRPEISGGDICVQACAHDPQVAVHAVRNLARIGFGRVSVRWSQLGFGRTSSTSRAQATPRNLMGFKDGTDNLKLEDAAMLREHLWVAPGDGPAWMAGGAYMVTRKIRMNIETWDRTSLSEQQQIFGRDKGEGAPLGAMREFDQLDFAKKNADGTPAIAMDAHVRLAHPSSHGGAHLLRRGYNFVDGSDGLGRLDAGLFFISYQRDPGKQFVPVQMELARRDPLNEYIKHVSSAVFACPPGLRDAGDYWGRALFA